MTRHDQLVQTAAARHRPMGWFAPSVAATAVMHADSVITVTANARTQPGRRLIGGLATPYASALRTHPTAPKQQNP